jgi:hypothetical protein
MFSPARSSTAKENQPRSHPDHIIKGLYPLRVMLKALAASNNVKTIVRVVQFLTPSHHINPSSLAKINPNIIAAYKELTDRTVNVQTSDL